MAGQADSHCQEDVHGPLKRADPHTILEDRAARGVRSVSEGIEREHGTSFGKGKPVPYRASQRQGGRIWASLSSDHSVQVLFVTYFWPGTRILAVLPIDSQSTIHASLWVDLRLPLDVAWTVTLLFCPES